MSEARARYPLGLKLGMTGVLLAVLPLLGVGLALIDVNVRAVKDQVRELQVAVAHDVARALGDDVYRARSGLRTLRRALVEGELADDTRLAVAMALLEDNPALDHAVVHDAAGAVIDVLRQEGTTPPAPQPLSPDSDHTQASVDGARVAVSLPLEVNGRTTGYLSTRVDLSALRTRVDRLAGAHFPDQPRPLRVVDVDGRVFAGDRTPLPEALLSALHAAKAGVAPSVEYDDGEPMTGAVVAVAGHPWRVVVQQPQAVVYGSLIQMRHIVVATIAVAIGLAVLVALLLARRITRPLQQLAGLADALRKREFGAVVEVHTQDELSLLGEALSDASRHLQASEDRLMQEVAIRTDLGRYLPREIVDKIVRREQDMRLGGQRSNITVLFADVVGFTPLTEAKQPEVVVTLLNELFTILTDIVFRHGGTIDKFIGDCVMAVWGAPEPDERHAARALTAAEDMLRWVEVGAAGWAKRYGVKLQLAIGVNTGEAVVGNIGSENRMEYTAIGDVVNVAARLEAIARPMQILVTEETREAAGPNFDYAPIGERPLSGRSGPVALYEVLH